MNHPDVVLGIDGDAADLAEDPVVRQRLWPGRIDGESRDIAGVRGAEASRMPISMAAVKQAEMVW